MTGAGSELYRSHSYSPPAVIHEKVRTRGRPSVSPSDTSRDRSSSAPMGSSFVSTMVNASHDCAATMPTMGSPNPRHTHCTSPESSSSRGDHATSTPHEWRPTTSDALVNPPIDVAPRELSPIVGSQYRGKSIRSDEYRRARARVGSG